MIRLTDDLHEAERFEKDSVFAAKAAANMLCRARSRAGGDSAAEVITDAIADAAFCTWVQDDRALIRQDSGDLILHAEENADFEELAAFLRSLNPVSIFTSVSAAKQLELPTVSDGIVMKRAAGSQQIALDLCDIDSPAFPEYSKLYSLLCRCGFALDSAEDFTADLAMRVHCRTARIVADKEYGAAAFTGYETASSAVISAVAVDRQQRRCGRGSAVLNRLCHALNQEKKQIFLYRERGKNKAFYLKNGFENCGEFAVCRLQ